MSACSMPSVNTVQGTCDPADECADSPDHYRLRAHPLTVSGRATFIAPAVRRVVSAPAFVGGDERCVSRLLGQHVVERSWWRLLWPLAATVKR